MGGCLGEKGMMDKSMSEWERKDRNFNSPMQTSYGYLFAKSIPFAPSGQHVKENREIMTYTAAQNEQMPDGVVVGKFLP
jgi:hypothetical protein